MRTSRMVRAPVVLVLAAASLSLAPALASAKCASPRVAVAPGAGADLPSAPVIHLFVPRSGPGPAAVGAVARVDGQPVAVDLDLASSAGAFDTWRVRVQGAAGRRLTLSYTAGSFSGELEYRIDPRWRAPRETPAVMMRARRINFSWPCSHTNTWSLEMATRASAYRVEWAASARAWQDTAIVPSVVVPRRAVDFWSIDDRALRGADPGIIELGHASCMGESIPERALDAPIYIKVFAVHADGSESPAWGAPRRLGDGPDRPGAEPEPVIAEVPRPIAAPAVEPAAVTTAPLATCGLQRAADRHGNLDGPFLGILLIGLTAAVAALVRAQRARAARMSPPPG